MTLEVLFVFLWSIGSGAFSGAVAAGIGFLAAKGESFDNKKFVRTVIIGLIIGACAAYAGVPYNEYYEYALTSGFILLIEMIAKAVVRRLPKRKPKVSMTVLKKVMKEKAEEEE